MLEEPELRLIHSRLRISLSVSENYSKECCNTDLYCNQNFSQKSVRHKIYVIILRYNKGLLHYPHSQKPSC